jgi:hypothetical protein
MLLEGGREVFRASQMPGVRRRLVEVEAGGGEERMVVEEARLFGDAGGPDVQQPAVASDLGPEEIGGPHRRIDVPRDVEDATGLGKRGDHERVP